ncbi:cyclophilin-like protein [Fomitopsis serialis]|uniref:cyclophilin-like protein n=1 Tax=Fomitopsis serialis TaxID=139415 RepID=UPI002007D699|nr:cyclophilin-like protein [Neoantrodia serialis]KAH9923268.1 cyclophilin-like protein [Neoantrodia serialis]
MPVTLHTSSGDIKIELFCEAVPKAAENFLALCASGYYDGCIWHRNIKGFMIQTGDPSGSGKGGQSIYGPPSRTRFVPRSSSTPWNVAMANAGPDTNKSQFFITYAKQPHLDGKYTIFGKRAPVNAKNRPLTEIKLNNITIHANPIADAKLQGDSCSPVFPLLRTRVLFRGLCVV